MDLNEAKRNNFTPKLVACITSHNIGWSYLAFVKAKVKLLYLPHIAHHDLS
jgi:hypothetical protein